LNIGSTAGAFSVRPRWSRIAVLISTSRMWQAYSATDHVTGSGRCRRRLDGTASTAARNCAGRAWIACTASSTVICA
jgi:hypothetical protein